MKVCQTSRLYYVNLDTPNLQTSKKLHLASIQINIAYGVVLEVKKNSIWQYALSQFNISN